MPTSVRLKLLILANCQATALERILEGIKGLDGAPLFDVLRIKPVFELVDDDVPYLESCLDACDVLLYQHHRNDRFNRWRTSDYWLSRISQCSSASFPSLYFTGYNPELTYIRKANGQRLNDGFSDYHDKRVVWQYCEGRTIADTVESLHGMGIRPTKIIENLHDSVSELKRRELEFDIDIKISGFIEQNYRNSRLFFTFNHPSNDVLIHVAKALLLKLGVSEYRLPELDGELMEYDYFPVIPKVSEVLELNFVDVCDEHVIQGERYRLQELVERYFDVYAKNEEVVAKVNHELASDGWFERRRVVLHIGQSKTATTTIQNALYQSRDRLKEHGIFYPDSGVVGGAHFGISDYFLKGGLFNSLARRSASERDALMAEIKREFLESSCELMVISSELFESFSPQHIDAILEEFSEFDVHVVCGLRGRLGWLCSIYGEIVKKAMLLDNFDQFLAFDKRVSSDAYKKLNTMEFLSPWLERLGKEHVHLCVMRRDSDFLNELLAAMGVRFEALIDSDYSALNQAVLPYTIEALRRFYKSSSLSNIPYKVATHFMNRVDGEIRKMTFDFDCATTFFESDKQVSSVLGRFLLDDLALARNFGFDRNDMGDMARERYFDPAHANIVYESMQKRMPDWYFDIKDHLGA